MELSDQLLFFFSALGAFNGIFLSGYFLFFHRPKKLSNFFLGILILALSLRIGKSVLLYFNPALPKIILQIGLTGCFFIGPALFFYLKSDIQNIQKISWQWKAILLSLTTLILLAGIIYPYTTYPDVWNQYYVRIIYWEWLLFMFASLFVLRKKIKKLFFHLPEITAEEKWWLGIYGSNALIFLAFFFVPHTSYILGSLIFSFSMYIIVMIFIWKRKAKSPASKTSIEKYPNKKIDQETANEWLEKLTTVMTEKEIFKNSSLKLKDVASEIGIPPHQLSQLLNDNLGKSFSNFTNEYRVESACQLLTTNDHLTLEGIGNEVGFNSKSTFYATFKKMKGMTPAKFKAALDKNTPTL